MDKHLERIAGDTPGTSYELAVYRFEGRQPSAPSAYLQAALHGNERPGVAALHYLMPLLAEAEAQGRLLGKVTVVPQANPIGAGQHLLTDHLGRFSFGTRVNFNREFPVPDAHGVIALDETTAPVFAERRLKSRLLALAAGHDIVLDLHCDDEALQYLYVAERLWPALADLAECLGAEAVICWSSMPDRAFEEAVYARMLSERPDDLSGCCVSTVELRGQADVDPDLAQKDARGLYRFLAGRGVVDDRRAGGEQPAIPMAVPLSHVEVINAPVGGTILYHVRPGDRVRRGALLAEILQWPGEEGGVVAVHAPQDGLVLSRRMRRLIRMGDDILKQLGTGPSANARDGTLDD